MKSNSNIGENYQYSLAFGTIDLDGNRKQLHLWDHAAHILSVCFCYVKIYVFKIGFLDFFLNTLHLFCITLGGNKENGKCVFIKRLLLHGHSSRVLYPGLEKC